MIFAEAVLDAALTVQLFQTHGALAMDVGHDLGCAQGWVAIEMEIRRRNMAEELYRPRMTPALLLAWGRAQGWT
jgi:hypothetical protein